MRRSGLVISAAALAALVTGAIAAPALADEGVTVTVHVQDAAGEPLSGADVSFLNDQDYVQLGETDSTGTIEGAGEEDSGLLRDGDWQLIARDFDQARLDAKKQFADLEQGVTIEAESSTEFTVTMQPGSRISGRITAPSGRPVQNVFVYPHRKRGVADAYDFFGMQDQTNARGAFTLSGLKPGRYKIFAQVADDPLGVIGSDSRLRDIEITKYGQVKVGSDVEDWQVRCTTGFSVTSPKKGQAKLSIKATAKGVGLTNPKGTIVVKRGSKTVKTIPWKSAKATTVLTRQPAGKKVTYTATYSGGDCLGWKASDKVTIKKK